LLHGLHIRNHAIVLNAVQLVSSTTYDLDGKSPKVIQRASSEF